MTTPPTRTGPLEVQIPAAGLTLEGTLHVPETPTGVGVVFIHGSGPNGRDEAISPGRLSPNQGPRVAILKP